MERAIFEGLFAGFFEIHEDHFGDGFEAFENPCAIGGASFEIGDFGIPAIEFAAKDFDGESVGEVAFVVLDDEGDFFDIVAVGFQIVEQIVHGDEIGFEAFGLAVGHEYDTVGTFHDEAAAVGIKELPRDGVKVKTRFKAANFGKFDG